MSHSSSAPARGAPHAKRDLTEGPITSTLLKFSLPMLGANALQSLNASVNQFWVSHILGVVGVTAISNANVLMMLAVGTVFGIGMASNILIAQAVGARDLPFVKRIMGTAIFFFFVLSCCLAVAGWTLAPVVLSLMHTPGPAKADAIIYLRIVFASMPFQYFFVFIQMAQRGAGDSRTPFYFMALAVLFDVCLNPLLISGTGPFPKLGIAGSATSTLVAQGISLLMMLVWLYRKRSILMLRPGELHFLKPDMKILRPLALRGLPMGLQMLIISLTGIIMFGFVNDYGLVTAAAYAGALQIWTYVQMPGMAIGASISSMAAQNVGAGKWDRVGKIAGAGLILSVCVTGSVAAVIYALGPLPLELFLPLHTATGAPSPTLPIALDIDRSVLWAFIIYNGAFTLSGVVRSTGAVWPPLAILAFSMVFLRIPFAYFLRPYFGEQAIWWSFPFGMTISSCLSGLYYRYGGWRKTRMIAPEATGQAPEVALATPVMDTHEEEEAVVRDVLAAS